jgi:hypothetical protein
MDDVSHCKVNRATVRCDATREAEEGGDVCISHAGRPGRPLLHLPPVIRCERERRVRERVLPPAYPESGIRSFALSHPPRVKHISL